MGAARSTAGMTRFAIRHETRYDYAGPVVRVACNVRLKPIAWSGQTLIEHRLDLLPAGQVTCEADGALVNLQQIAVAGPTETVSLISRASVEVDRAVPMPDANDPGVGEVGRLAGPAPLDPRGYLAPSPRVAFDAEIAAWAAPSLAPGRGVLEAVDELSRRLFREIRFKPGVTTVASAPREAFDQRAGVCQDFAHIMLAALRAHRVPAAYVSGYVRTYPMAGQPKLFGSDASHAWVLVWGGPAQGWVGIDPTNAIWMANDHVVMAIGRDYGDVTPVDGVFYGPGGGTMRVSVDVAPVDVAPSLTPA